jgi:hypothetical protein
METDKEIRTDAKLKGRAERDPQFADDLWLMRNPGEDGEKLTLEAIAAAMPALYGLSCSVSSLSEFYKWLRLKKRIESAAERSSQARLALASDPGMTPELLARVGQMVFTAETIEEGNVKAYVELVKLQLQAKSLEINAGKLKLLVDAAAEAKAKLTALTNAAKSNGGLTPETLRQIEEAAGLL